MNFGRTFCAGLVLQTQSTIASTNFCCSQLLIQFIVNNIEEFYLSIFLYLFFWHLSAWAFLSIIFSYIPTATNFVPFPFESKLLLRSELPVVTLGKSLPGNCSKLGYLFAWAFLSIIFFTYQLQLILCLFHFESKLLLRSELPVVTLGKSLPGNCSKLENLFAWAFLSIVFHTSQLKLILSLSSFKRKFLWLFVVDLLLRT